MLFIAKKRIILGVTGGVSAYKAAELVRKLKKAQAIVRVVMTPNACHFISPMTLQALSGYPVHVHLMDLQAEAAMGHIELARWAECILIAPASANFISNIAQGQAHHLLLTLCLATKAPIYIAPAMNQVMWSNAFMQDNIKKLKKHHITIWGPDTGEQACGDNGLGRLLEPEVLFNHLNQVFSSDILYQKKVLITAGPTQEPIDPVRYITNHSSGKMGFALAEAAAMTGADVTLITGPVHLDVYHANINRINIIQAQQMYDAVIHALQQTTYHLFIGAAAVSDYRPSQASPKKMKKSYHSDCSVQPLELTQTLDIIKTVAILKKNRPYTVGFSAETEQLIPNAQAKLAHKKLDMIIANLVAQPHHGFYSDTNAVEVFYQDQRQVFPMTDKKILATQLIQCIGSKLK
ncbi:MAG: bifunctional phosphopantothenoylcysteine decarboxylase/phosphopantothenate--cysteine ligase CoaBC [Endozoicomonadaceae bacterium]|nr:bifunctional phosphopantothenoylcysteine decarboxylase/phosphopantothenate--cysteine ligase CoaBC [Endozoicomonadaceae bacterium]